MPPFCGGLVPDNILLRWHCGINSVAKASQEGSGATPVAFRARMAGYGRALININGRPEDDLRRAQLAASRLRAALSDASVGVPRLTQIHAPCVGEGGVDDPGRRHLPEGPGVPQARARLGRVRGGGRQPAGIVGQGAWRR